MKTGACRHRSKNRTKYNNLNDDYELIRPAEGEKVCQPEEAITL
jgi:hypothetical protein